MLLENFLPKNEIERILDNYEVRSKEFIKNYAENFPLRNAEEDLKVSSHLNKLLNNNVLTKLIEESKELSNKKINNVDLKQIVEFALATLTKKDYSILLGSDFLCGRCGKCCIKASPISITSKEYSKMTEIEPTLIIDIEPDLELGCFKFVVDNPCKFYDEKSKKCRIYNLRPYSCRRYPIADGGVVGDGECEYMVSYIFEKSRAILIECLKR